DEVEEKHQQQRLADPGGILPLECLRAVLQRYDDISEHDDTEKQARQRGNDAQQKDVAAVDQRAAPDKGARDGAGLASQQDQAVARDAEDRQRQQPQQLQRQAQQVGRVSRVCRQKGEADESESEGEGDRQQRRLRETP